MRILLFIIFVSIPLISIGQNSINSEMIKAAEENNEKKVLELIRQGADVNVSTNEGVTALMYAVDNENYYICEVLLKNKANPNIIPYSFPTALITACQKNNDKITDLLLKYGAKPDLKDYSGLNALNYCVKNGYIGLAENLLAYGANPKTKCLNEDAMLIAAFYGDTAFVDLLIKYGGDVNSTDNFGFTPLMVAAQNNYPDVVKLLLKNGAQIEAVNNQGTTSLCIATAMKNTQVVKLLIENGANVNHTIKKGITPRVLSRIYKSYEIESILKNSGAKSSFTPLFRSAGIGFVQTFSNEDYFLGFEFTLNEMNTNLVFQSGFLFRPFRKTILIQEREHFYYQLHEKRNIGYLGIAKRITLLSRDRMNFGMVLGVDFIKSFGKFYGTERKINEEQFYVPYGGIFYIKRFYGCKISYQYLDFKYHQVVPHMINCSLFFNINTLPFRYSKKDLEQPSYFDDYDE